MTQAKTRTKARAKTKAKVGKRGSRKVADEKQLTRLIEDMIDEGATTAEEINRAVLDLPVTVLESLGLAETAGEVKKIQDSSIGAIYDLIRDINHKVADLAIDLLEQPRKKIN